MNIPFVTKINDDSINTLIIPEIYTHFIFEYPKSKKIIWWLSVDNFITIVKGEKKNPIDLMIRMEKYASGTFNKVKFILYILVLFFKSFKKKYKQLLSVAKLVPSYSKKIKTGDFELPKHWVQSFYAKNYLKRLGISDALFLSDFLDAVFINDLKNIDFQSQTKKNVIVYNPKKGFEITQKLITASKDIEWVAIENMTPEQVKNLLVSSKLYIDFGNHPGKDRIPREAAMCGCIVITNKKGSANFFNDVPIPDQYKIEYSPKTEGKIVELFRLCFSDYEERTKEFDAYRAIIEKEEQVFNQDLGEVIKQHLTN